MFKLLLPVRLFFCPYILIMNICRLKLKIHHKYHCLKKQLYNALMMSWCNLTCRTTCSHITKSMRCSLCDCVLMYVCVCSSHRCYVVWAASGGFSLLWLPVSRPISPESSRPINGLCGWWLAAPCQLPPTPWKHCHLAPRYTCFHLHRQRKQNVCIENC